MKNILCLFAVVSLTFTSCKKEEDAKEVTVSNEVSPFSDDFKGAEAPAVTSSPVPPAPGMAPAGTTTTAVTQAPVTVAKGMNPAHGQQGHRCDIAVGAPLNSSPGKAPAVQPKPATTISSANTASGTVTSNGATITTVNNNAPAATPTVTDPGMNPPHGQEGHVCSVAVGAPLPKKE
ncbi:MAG: hypothetical protein ACOVJ8_07590 [Sediminibacterium sp.]